MSRNETRQGSEEVLHSRRQFLARGSSLLLQPFLKSFLSTSSQSVSEGVSLMTLPFSAALLSACSQQEKTPLMSGIDSVRGIRLSEESRGLFDSMDRFLNDPEFAIKFHIQDASESLEMRRVRHFTTILFEFFKRDELFLQNQKRDAQLPPNRRRFQGLPQDATKKRFESFLPQFSFADSVENLSPLKSQPTAQSSRLRSNLERDVLIEKGTPIRNWYLQQFPEYFESQNGRLKEKVLFLLFFLKNILGRPVHRTDIEGKNAVVSYRTVAIGRSLFQLLLKNEVESEGQVVVYGRDFFEGMFASSDTFIQSIAEQMGERISTTEIRTKRDLTDLYVGCEHFLRSLSHLSSSRGIANIQEGIGRFIDRLTTTTPNDVEKEATQDEKDVKNNMLKLLHDIDHHPFLSPSDKDEFRVILVVALVGAVAFNEKLLGSVKTILRTAMTSVIPL